MTLRTVSSDRFPGPARGTLRGGYLWQTDCFVTLLKISPPEASASAASIAFIR